MKTKFLSIGVALMFFVTLSCQNEDENLAQTNEVPESVLTQIKELGFSTTNVQRVENGFLVEGDIILDDHDLKSGAIKTTLRVAQAEQYRTTNIVSAPRVIKISVASTLGAAYVQAVDEVVSRYNALNLTITFQRVSSGADIQIVKANFFEQFLFLAAAGFPTANGKPHNQIKVSALQLNSQPLQTKASVIAHEIGHCIGFRHTDYADRSFICGGNVVNEGASIVGAVLIPGTPAAADPNSWMLACIGQGQNRPFNANDIIALQYLY